MILKERNPAEHAETDIFSTAGAKAEEQMAFYLRRVFYNDPDIFVFNDLRFKTDTNDSAQIDHLVLHRHGFIIIESKSISSYVVVNKYGEWIRFWEGKPHGMPSPIQQAKFQAEFLRTALDAYAKELLDRVIFNVLQPRFMNCPFEIIVAISDKGSIKRDIPLPEVIKADQVPDRIKEIYQRHKKSASFFSFSTGNDGLYNFKDEEMQRISKFLLEHHYPLNYQKAKMVRESHNVQTEITKPVYASSTIQSKGAGICNKCSTQSKILWGKYGYYWKCPQCNNNMPIKEFCPACKNKLKVRKEKNSYFIFCEQCKTECVYYIEK